MLDTAEKAASAVAHSLASATAISVVSSVTETESVGATESRDAPTSELSEPEQEEKLATHITRAKANACRRTFTLTD